MKQRSIICWIAALALILTCAVSAEGAEEAAMDYRTEGIPCQNGTAPVAITPTPYFM